MIKADVSAVTFNRVKSGSRTFLTKPRAKWMVDVKEQRGACGPYTGINLGCDVCANPFNNYSMT